MVNMEKREWTKMKEHGDGKEITERREGKEINE